MHVVYKSVKILFLPTLMCPQITFSGGHLWKLKNIMKNIHSTYVFAHRRKTKNDQSVIQPIFEIQWIGLLKTMIRSEKIVQG